MLSRESLTVYFPVFVSLYLSNAWWIKLIIILHWPWIPHSLVSWSLYNQWSMISLPSMGSIGQLRQTSVLKLPHQLTTLETHGGQMHSLTLLNLWATDGQFKEDTGEPTVYAQEINPIKLRLDHQLSGDQLQNRSLVSTYHNWCLNFQCWIADRQENKGEVM